MLRQLVCLLFVSAFAVVPLAAQTFVFHLSGDQEIPPVPSTASGGCHGVLNQPAAQFSITCVHSVVGASVMHIHRSPTNEIVFDMGDPASPVTVTWTGMTPGEIADLLAGVLYVNIHTAGRPTGEIRGQILPRTVDLVPFTADGAQVVPPNETSSTATCTADLNNAATAMDVQCTHNVPSADAAHVHEAPFGENGPILFTFPGAASPLSASVPLTPQQVASFAATFLYLDIHAEGTEEEPGDEVRGQIGTPPEGASSGTIVIRKATFPGGGTGFSFTDTITPGAFLLDDGGSRTFNNVEPGTYTVSENDPAAGGYTLADVSCDDLDSTGDTPARSATIRVEAGETVTCTFRNLQTSPTDDLFVFHLSGDQEEPVPVPTTERGGCMGRFDSGASELTLVCTHDVDDATLMHIHRAPAGENGDVVHDLGDPASPVIATWSEMTPANVADLFAGNLYINIHTAGRPAGVIRGQVLPRTVDTIAFPLDASQVVPPGVSPASGDCTADLNASATQLAVNCTHTLAGADEAHVHDAPRGENGPLVHSFPSAASPFGGNVALTPRLVADFAAYFLYVDVHAEGEEEGEGDTIRGQIGEPPPVFTTGTIRIVKSTSPAGGTGFDFTDDVPGSGGAFTLDDGGVETFAEVPAGTYTFTEAVAAGHALTDISCDDADSTGNPFARTATVRLQENETVTCTFHNLQSVASPSQLFVFHLSGDQEEPPNDSSARGGCFGQLDAGAATFSLVCTHNVVGPALMHIHRGAPGENGDVVFDLGDPVSPVEATWSGMTAAQITDLLAGNYYINVHASGRPAGEIRGQILPRTVDSFSFPATGAQEVPATDSTETGNCTADLADNAQSLFVRCTHTVPDADTIHLHDAPPGEDGPVVFDYPLGNPFSGTTPTTPRLVADFAAGFLYVNIHSPDYETGEIRGQLIAGAPAVASVGIPTAGEWGLLLLAVGLAMVAIRRL